MKASLFLLACLAAASAFAGNAPASKGKAAAEVVETSERGQRRNPGRGMFVIRYQNGRIVRVIVQQSTGDSSLDSRTVAWIKSRWRIKSGTSGTAVVPITWKLE